MNRLAILFFIHLAVVGAAEDVSRQVRDLGKAGRTADVAAMDRLAQGLDAMDANVRAAAIVGLSQAWPAGAQHLDQVRRSLDDFDPAVRQAALGYAGQVGDDIAIPTAIRYLADRDQATAQAAHLALTALARSDKGSDASVWETWAEERERVVQPIVDRARSAAQKHDVQAVSETIQALLFMRDRPAMVGRILLELANDPDPAVAQLGLGALGVVAKPEIIAALARDPDLARRVAEVPTPVGPSPQSVVASKAQRPSALAPAPPGGISGFAVIAAICVLGALAVFCWPKAKSVPAAPVPPAKKSKITFSN